MTNLILIRHGQSEWNAKNLFTGWVDVDLTDQGRQDAKKIGDELKAQGITPEVAYTSALKRAQNTLTIVLEILGLSDLPVTKDQALNERNYGDLAGMNKDEARQKFGEEQVHIWRRSYDVAPPGEAGESLKDTEERSWPYFESEILPQIKAGKTVIISAHGNSLRSIIKRLDGLTPDQIVKVEIPFGVPMCYTIDEEGNVVSKTVDLAA